MYTHQEFMNEALKEATKASQKKEVPIGAIIIKKATIIARTHNLKETLKDCTAHAELLAIKTAQEHLGDWRLNGCILYSTLEPCPMCMGAILHARIDKVIYGAKDHKWGACGSQINLSDPKRFNHYTQTIFYETEACAKFLTDFFKKIR